MWWTLAAVVVFVGGVKPDDPYVGAVAAGLLAAPPGTPEAEPPPGMLVPLRKALEGLAIQQELMSASEREYFWSHSEYDEDDCGGWRQVYDRLIPGLERLRQRRVDVEGAPPVADAGRYPPLAVVERQRAFGEKFRAVMRDRAANELDRSPELLRAVGESEALTRVWDCLWYTSDPNYGVYWKRLKLKELRDLLGEEAYLAGEVPPPVPAWRFIEVKP